MSACHVVLVIGPPASGKSTLCEQLASQLDFKHVDVGACLRRGTDEGTWHCSCAARLGPGCECRRTEALKAVSEAKENGQRLLLNGFPRVMGGMKDLRRILGPAGVVLFALVLEAPEDVLRERSLKRRADGERDEDEAAFLVRLQHHRDTTSALIENLAEQRLVRYVDATASKDWVLAEAASHFTASAVLIMGVPGHRQSEMAAAAAASVRAHHLHVEALVRASRLEAEAAAEAGEPASSTDVVSLIEAEMSRLGRAGGFFLIDGFPRSAEDLIVWQSISRIEVTLVLRVDCGTDSSAPPISSEVDDLLNASIEVLHLSSDLSQAELLRQAVVHIRTRAPLSIAVGCRAAVQLCECMRLSSDLRGGRLSEDAFAEYRDFLREAARMGGTSATCPSPSVWLLWLTHMLDTEAYAQHAGDRLLGYVPGPLWPPKVTDRSAAPPSETVTSRSGSAHRIRWNCSNVWLAELRELLPQSLLERTPAAFTDALDALGSASLGPLREGRAYLQPHSVVKELLDLLVSHYRCFLAAAADEGPRGNPVSPSMEIDWLWHAHISHPTAYAEDCLHQYGRVLPHKPGWAEGGPPGPESTSARLSRGVRGDLESFALDHADGLALLAQGLQPDLADLSTGSTRKSSAAEQANAKTSEEVSLAAPRTAAEEEEQLVAAIRASLQERAVPRTPRAGQEEGKRKDANAKTSEEVPRGRGSEKEAGTPRVPGKAATRDSESQAESQIITVTVRNVAGKTLCEAKVAHDATVLSIRERLWEVRQDVPPNTSKLIVGHRDLDNKERLYDVGVGDGCAVLLVHMMMQLRLTRQSQNAGPVWEEERSLDIPAGARVGELRQMLLAQGEPTTLRLFSGGGLRPRALNSDTEYLAAAGIKDRSIVTFKREPSPPPSPASSYSCRCCSCFTADCVFTVLDGTHLASCKMSDLAVGDVVCTGAPDIHDSFRRITAIWPSRIGGWTATVNLSPGCRLTTGHPVKRDERWQRPEELAHCELTREEEVYTLELEGHVDTVLVGHAVGSDSADSPVVCAAIGMYCGEAFGWNIFTRKTVPCDEKGCSKCAVAVHRSIDFSKVDASMMKTRYEPY